MTVGILDLLSTPATNWLQIPYRFLLTKQYVSIMPQAIATWCRQMGHTVHYGTYFGYGEATDVLPRELDVLFVSAFTHTAPMAYALAKLYRDESTLTVIGGPHAKAFPEDCLRFFDVVVGECDQDLIANILAKQVDLHRTVSSGRPPTELPTVQERLPYVKKAVFVAGQRYPASTVPMLASTGCPFSCDFCIDWNNPYHRLPTELLDADLAYLAQHIPRVRISFHDPNLAAGFNAVLDSLEKVPPRRRSPVALESSLASLRNEERLRRLRGIRCVFIGVGIESWTGYSQKAGAGDLHGAAKVQSVVEQLARVAEHVPYLQASVLFGLDGDRGDSPVQHTKDFMTAAPFVWPALNIPQPFGNTPLFTAWQREGRLLTSMPFYFYQMPFLVSIPRHYDPMSYYDRIIDLISHATSATMLRRRLATVRHPQIQALHVARTVAIRQAIVGFKRALADWRRDREVLRFHHRETTVLPTVYERMMRRSLGPLSTLLSRAELTPELPAVQ